MCYNMNVMTVWMKPVDVARNEIAEKAVEMGARFIFFIDEDVTPPGHALRQLIYQAEHHPEGAIFGGIYCHKSPPAMPMIFKNGLGAGPYWDWKVGEFFEVDGISMGCTLVRVDALASIPKPWFKCYSADTEVLTKRGWLAWPDVKDSDEFATRNVDGWLEWQFASSLTNLPHNGEMVSFKGEASDLLVTENHRMYGFEWKYDCTKREGHKGPLQFIAAKDVASRFSKRGPGQRGFRVPSTVSWLGTLPPEGDIFQLTSVFDGPGPKPIKRSIDLSDWVAFLGLYLAEGSCEGTFKQYGITKNAVDDPRSHYEQAMAFVASGMPANYPSHPSTNRSNATRVAITQAAKSRYYAEINSLLEKLPWRFRPTVHGFVVNDKGLHHELFRLGNKYIKHVPQWVKDLPASYLEIFLTWFNKGDGSIRKNGDRVYFTTSKQLADDLQEIILKIGRSATIRKYAGRAATVGDRVIDKSRTAAGYFLYERKANYVTLGSASTENYEGRVYCATVPNEVLYVRRNGKPMWCGNTVDDASAYWDGVPKAEMWTEDLWLCDRAIKAGWKVYADASVLCEHWSIETMSPTVLPPDCLPRRRAGWTKGTKKIVDLGCGENPYTTDEGDVLTVDIRENVNPDYRCDLRKLPFATGEFNIVYSSHVLEHFPRNAVPEILDEWIRILKDDGEFRLIVPNIEWAAKEIVKGTINNDVMNVLYGAQSYGENFHQMGFTPKVLTEMLTERGFKRIDVELMHYNLCMRAWRKVPKNAPKPLGEIVQAKKNGHKKTKQPVMKRGK
jgi:predicted SAM-dependent methyltransferase